MKVVYKKTIVEKMEEAIMEAKYKGKEIEKFILTRDEWDEWHTTLLKMTSLKDINYFRGHLVLLGR